MGLLSAGAAALVATLVLVLPTVTATIVMTPNYNQGCNGNPFGSLQQYRPIGRTGHATPPPGLAGGYLVPGVGGSQHANSAPGVTSSAIESAQYFMVGPHAGTGVPTCWTPVPGKAVSLSATWNVSWNPYLSSNCTTYGNTTNQSTSLYMIYLTDNFHFASGGYAISPFSPHQVVDAFADGCGAAAYAPGWLSKVVTVTTPTLLSNWNTTVDFYTALWVSTNAQQNTTAPAPAYSGVSWQATLVQVVCTNC